MAIRELALTIKPVFQGQQAEHGLRTQSKLLREQKKDVTELGKTHSKVVKEATRDQKALSKATLDFQDDIRRTNEQLLKLKADPKGFKEVLRVQKEIAKEQEKLSKDPLLKRIFSGKNMLIGGAAIGAAAFGIGKTAYEQAQSKILGERKAKREFGAAGAKTLQTLSGTIATSAGVEDDEALKALIPIERAIQTIQKGQRTAGGKVLKTDADVTKQQEQSRAMGAKLVTRLMTLHPEMAADQIGQIIADAGTGNEGMRRLMSEFGLSKHSRVVAEANEKGKLYDQLSDAERKEYNIKRKGDKLGQGALVDLVLRRSGESDEAATDERKRLGFKLRAAKAKMSDSLGERAAKLMEGHDQGGGPLAGIIDKLPQLADFGMDHAGALAAITGVGAGAVGIGALVKKFGGGGGNALAGIGGGASKALAGLGGVEREVLTGALGDMLPGAGGGSVVPVEVTNWPGDFKVGDSSSMGKDALDKAGKSAGVGAVLRVAGQGAGLVGAGLAATAAHDYLLQNLDVKGSADSLKEKLASGEKRFVPYTNPFMKFITGGGGKYVDVQEQNRAAVAAQFRREQAAMQAANPAVTVNPTINVMLDGKVLAVTTAPHVIESIKRQVHRDSAGGAAPTSR